MNVRTPRSTIHESLKAVADHVATPEQVQEVIDLRDQYVVLIDGAKHSLGHLVWVINKALADADARAKRLTLPQAMARRRRGGK